jgi:hypothetical protein
VLRPSTIDALRQILAFRHFFRHAYTVEFEAERLADLQRTAIIVGPALRDDFERFDAFLAALAAPPA